MLEFADLTPRLAEKAQTKLEEARAAQELDADLERGMGGWPGGVLIGATGEESPVRRAEVADPTNRRVVTRVRSYLTQTPSPNPLP